MSLTKSGAKSLDTPGAAPAKLEDETTVARNTAVPFDDEVSAQLDTEFDRTSSGTAIAETSANKQVANSSQSNVLDTYRSSAFASLDGTTKFGSFPGIKLEGGSFSADGEDVKEFECQFISTRKKWIYKTKDKEGPFFYSYDQVSDTAGTPIADILANWKADGHLFAGASEYSEAVVLMLSGTKLDAKLALLNIAPASVGRLEALSITTRMRHKCDLDQIAVKVSVGTKVTTKAGKVFTPWDFTFVRKLEG